MTVFGAAIVSAAEGALERFNSGLLHPVSVRDEDLEPRAVDPPQLEIHGALGLHSCLQAAWLPFHLSEDVKLRLLLVLRRESASQGLGDNSSIDAVLRKDSS